MGVATIANWGFNLLVTVTFLELIDVLGRPGTFFLYAILTVAGLYLHPAPGAGNQGPQPGGDRGRSALRAASRRA